jgi:hypothetical protein
LRNSREPVTGNILKVCVCSYQVQVGLVVGQVGKRNPPESNQFSEVTPLQIDEIVR